MITDEQLGTIFDETARGFPEEVEIGRLVAGGTRRGRARRNRRRVGVLAGAVMVIGAVGVGAVLVGHEGDGTSFADGSGSQFEHGTQHRTAASDLQAVLLRLLPTGATGPSGPDGGPPAGTVVMGARASVDGGTVSIQLLENDSDSSQPDPTMSGSGGSGPAPSCGAGGSGAYSSQLCIAFDGGDVAYLSDAGGSTLDLVTTDGWLVIVTASPETGLTPEQLIPIARSPDWFG